jgi:hypothetical protein
MGLLDGKVALVTGASKGSVVKFSEISFEISTLHSGGYNETACGTNDLTGDPG